MTERLVTLVRGAIESVSEPRLFRSERGYQGALLAEISRRLATGGTWPGDPLVEQEYQKRIDIHGLKIRPDIIVHIPFERRTVSTRRHGNFVVMELKRRATRTQAFKDFEKLSRICDALNYPLGIFVNIDARKHYLAEYEGLGKNRLYAFAVALALIGPSADAGICCNCWTNCGEARWGGGTITWPLPPP